MTHPIKQKLGNTSWNKWEADLKQIWVSTSFFQEISVTESFEKRQHLQVQKVVRQIGGQDNHEWLLVLNVLCSIFHKSQTLRESKGNGKQIVTSISYCSVGNSKLSWKCQWFYSAGHVVTPSRIVHATMSCHNFLALNDIFQWTTDIKPSRVR